jgi:hypothetical protein
MLFSTNGDGGGDGRSGGGGGGGPSVQMHYWLELALLLRELVQLSLRRLLLLLWFEFSTH